MSCIHFKFSNAVEDDRIKFDGLHISVADLKEAIVKQKSLKSNLFSLKIVDSQTKKEYSDDKEMLPRNTSVVVRRVPLASAQKIPKAKFKDPTLPQSDTITSIKAPAPSSKDMTSITSASTDKKLTAEELRKTADLANADASEADKLTAVMHQSTEGYDPSQYVWAPRGGANSTNPGILPGLKKNPPPLNYVCYRCGNRGHWIQMCPTNGDPNFNRAPKRAMGIPSSEIVAVNEEVPGAMLDRYGRLVVRAVDFEAVNNYRNRKKQPAEEAPKALEPPPELLCSLCKELMKDAVIISCCGESYCYDCIQDYLCENEFTCPACKKEGVSPVDNLAPNKALRTSAKNFQMKAAEHKSVAEASTTGFVKKALPTLPTPQSVTARPTPALSKAAAPSKAAAVKQEGKGSDGKSSAAPSAKIKEKPVENATATPEIIVEPSKNVSDKTADSATKAGAATTGEVGDDKQDNLEVKVQPDSQSAKSDKSSSRSGSPVSGVASPALSSAATTGGGGGGAGGEKTAAVNAELLAKMAAMKQASSLPGMLSGVPLTNSALPGLGLPGATAPGMLRAPPHHPHQASLYSQMLGMPSAMLPGQAVGLVPTQSKARASGTSSDPTKLDRLAAELLLSSAVSKKRASSPAPSSPPVPLSQDEFYRHQKLLKLFAKKKGSGSSSPYSTGSSSSSRSNSYSRSRSRSHSRSPLHSRGGSRKQRSKHKRDKHHERSREKRRARDRDEAKKPAKQDKERSKHRRSKRKRHESPAPSPEREGSRHKRSRRHRSRSKSPGGSGGVKKLSLEELAGSVVVDLASPAQSVASSVARSEVKMGANEVLEEAELSSRVRKHKKKSKKKHKRRHRDSEGEMEVTAVPAAVAGDTKELAPPEVEGVALETEPNGMDVDSAGHGVGKGVNDVGEVEETSLAEDTGTEQGTRTESVPIPEEKAAEGQHSEEGGDNSQESEPAQEPPSSSEPSKEADTEKVDDISTLTSPSSPASSTGTSVEAAKKEDGEEAANEEGKDETVEVAKKEDGEAALEEETDKAESVEATKEESAVEAAKKEAEAEVEESVEISLDVHDLAELDPSLEDASTTSVSEKESSVESDTPSLTEEDLDAILDHLEPLKHWDTLGHELHVPGRKLSKYQQKSPVDALEKVLTHWLERAPRDQRSWGYLVKALRKIGEGSVANSICKQYLPDSVVKIGKEEGEISDSDESSHKNTDLRELLNSSLSQSNEPDLRETINSHKSALGLARKRHITAEEDRSEGEEGEEEEEEEEGAFQIGKVRESTTKKSSSKRFKKSSSTATARARGKGLANRRQRSFSSSDVSDSLDDSASSFSESEEEIAKPSKSKRKAKKQRRSSQSKYKSRERGDRERERERGKERKREKKPKKDKKRKSSRSEHRQSSSKSSHKSKRSSKTDHHEERHHRREKSRPKKHKKSSSHSHH